MIKKLTIWTDENQIVWQKDLKRNIYRSFQMPHDLQNLIWVEMQISYPEIILHIYPYELKQPQYDKLGGFIRPNSSLNFEKYVSSNTPLFTFRFDTESYYGWLELLQLYFAVKHQQDTKEHLNINNNIANADYYLKLMASVE